jgi:PAS domain S-box-containing protein
MRAQPLNGGSPAAAHRDVGAVSGGATHASRRFPAVAPSVAEARHFLLSLWPEECGESAAAALMLSELATNAVQHASTDFEVAVDLAPDGRHVRVAVSDTAETFPVPQDTDTEASDGRGLHIVRELADAWGIDVRRGRPGKTVWFWLLLPAPGAPVPALALAPCDPVEARQLAEAPASRHGSAHPHPSWSEPGMLTVLGGLRDAVVATDEHGQIHYANTAAEELMGWPVGSLTGRSALDLVPESLAGPLREGFENFARFQTGDLVGRRLPAVIKRADGSEVDTELVLSVFDQPQAGSMVVGIFRPHDERKLQRWAELTNELLEILADAPLEDPPAERLLSTLGRRLGWDVTALWSADVQRELVCHAVWTSTPAMAPAFAQEKPDDPTGGSVGLPRWVIEHGEPLWVTDLVADGRFMTEALAHDGLQSAYAFPIRYHGACVGVVEMLSRDLRERDPSVVELMAAVGGHLGELLHATAQATERRQLLDQLLEARRRNEFLLLAAQVLSEVVDYGEMIQRLAQVAVPVLADLCLIDIEDEEGNFCRMAAWHADPKKRELTEELKNSFPPDPAGDHPIMQVMRSGHSMWSTHMDDEFLLATSRNERQFSILKTLGFTSYMTVPLRQRDDAVLGTLTLVSAGSGRRFSEKDLGLAEQMAKQVGSVVSSARVYDRERRISHELQRNLLPDAIPSIRGWDVAARYLPAAMGVEVGGDWYDVVPITDSLVALVVGDVQGHDLGAAKIMSRHRHTLELLVREEQSPGKALERLNQFCLLGSEQRLATALVGVLDRSNGTITFSSAGHPPPLHVHGDKALELPVPPGPPLGVQRCRYKDHRFELDDGCLVMFTDGLVERRGSFLDERFGKLEMSLRAAPSSEPGVVADFVIEAMTSDERSSDDIVVLTARRGLGAA